MKTTPPLELTAQTKALFAKTPGTYELYAAVETALCNHFEDIHIEVFKTQVSFSAKRGFASVWLPIRRMAHRPQVYIVLSFGLDRPISSPRIIEVVQPYPNRFMHHLLITAPEDLDTEILEWLQAAYTFARSH